MESKLKFTRATKAEWQSIELNKNKFNNNIKDELVYCFYSRPDLI